MEGAGWAETPCLGILAKMNYEENKWELHGQYELSTSCYRDSACKKKMLMNEQ